MESRPLDEYLIFGNGKKKTNSIGDVPIFGGNGVLGYSGDFNNSDCLAIGRVGAYCGSLFLVKNKCWISDNCIWAKIKNSNSLEYFYYLLKTLSLNQRRIGTGQPLLTQDILKRIEVKIPSLVTQRKIASILGDLDSKIELNNRVIANLEEQLQSVYKSWFVDFSMHEGELKKYKEKKFLKVGILVNLENL